MKASEFYNSTRDARKVIVVDLGFLGDSVHLIPALWEIKKNHPQADLHLWNPWLIPHWVPRQSMAQPVYGAKSRLRSVKFSVQFFTNFASCL